MKEIFKKLTTYHHFLVFLIILTVLKIANVFITEGSEHGFQFALLGVGLIVISTVLHFIFSFLFDKKKKYLHSLISTFLVIVMLSHADPEPIRGVMVILFLYVAKFFIKYKGENIFNPVAFTIGFVTLISFFLPNIGVPPMDFTGIDIRFPIAGMQIPLPILPITLALIFNVGRLKKHPLALTYILFAILIGATSGALTDNLFSFLTIVLFTGTALVVEPKTSPTEIKHQVIYGGLLAIFIATLDLLSVPNAIVLGLLVGNLAWYIFKKIKTT